MKERLIRLAVVGFAVVPLAARQPLPWPQQYSSQGVQSGGAVALFGGIDRLAVLSQLLTLTANQQARAKAIFDDEETVTKPLIEQLKQSTDAVTAAERTANTDPDFEQLAANLATIAGQLLAADAKAQSKVFAKLTAAQQQEIEQLPRHFFVPTAPLPPPGPIFISSASGGH